MRVRVVWVGGICLLILGSEGVAGIFGEDAIETGKSRFYNKLVFFFLSFFLSVLAIGVRDDSTRSKREGFLWIDDAYAFIGEQGGILIFY